jgi:subtilisin family serine protease
VVSTDDWGSATPNDIFYPEQWALPRIKVPGAWGFTTGSSSIKVCMVDTGVDYYHPDIVANLWQNPIEAPHGYNGIDDDHNGKVDCQPRCRVLHLRRRSLYGTLCPVHAHVSGSA